MQRAMSGSTRANWEIMDLITMEVSGMEGGKERYSNFAVNGKQVKKQPQLGTGWLDFAGFNVELSAIFDPITRTNFTFIGDVNLPSGLAAAYGFQFHSADNHKFRLITGVREFHPGLSGSLWIDKHTGNLLRVEGYATELDPWFSVNFYSNETNYGEVPISKIGTFLLPAAREFIACQPSGDDVHCFRDKLSFYDCRKFGTEAHILPDAGEQH
jgi:hypothetical protein